DGAQPTLIMPAEIAESAPEGGVGVDELIGTGPYELVDWVTDQRVHFESYDDYVPKDGPDEGLSGDRSGPYKNVYFELVTDSSTRVSGIQTGEYDIATAIPQDNAAQLEADNGVELDIVSGDYLNLVYNKAEGL